MWVFYRGRGSGSYSMHACMNLHTYVLVHIYIIYIRIYIYMAANQKHWPCNRLGRPFRDKGLQQTGVFPDKPLRQKPLEDYSTLHRGPRQGFVTEGQRQRFVTEGGGPRQHGVLIDTHVYICMCIYIYFTYMYVHTCMCARMCVNN